MPNFRSPSQTAPEQSRENGLGMGGGGASTSLSRRGIKYTNVVYQTLLFAFTHDGNIKLYFFLNARRFGLWVPSSVANILKSCT